MENLFWQLKNSNYILDGIKCYECRSDVLRACGDPFNINGGIPQQECSLSNTNPSYVCYKSSQYGKTYCFFPLKISK